MKYANLIDQTLHYAPHVVQWRGRTAINPSGEKLVELGYKPVRHTEPGEAPEGFAWVPHWEEQAEEIVQVWELEELQPEEPSAEELLEIILGGEEA